MKRIFIIVLALGMALSLLSGCGQSQEAPAETPAAQTAAETPAAQQPAESAPAPAGLGLGGTGFASYPADTVVAWVENEEVDWIEYFYWLQSYTEYIQQVAAQYGFVLSGWNECELSPELTNAELVLSHTHTTIIQNHAARQRIEELGGSLTETEEAEINAIFDQNADMVTGNSDGEASDEERAQFESHLEQMNINRAFFDQLNRDMYLIQKGFELIYGENGSELSDEDVLDYAEESGLMSAKHILLLTVDPDSREPLSDGEIAQKKALADSLYAQLSGVRDDPEALEALFDELCAANTEDNGYAAYPDGYVFGEGEMVTAFEDAVKGLQIGELSEIVESEYGYHIILRTAIDPDAVIGMNENGKPTSLRYAAAAQFFSGDLLDWTDEAHVEWTDGFETPDLAAIFG